MSTKRTNNESSASVSLLDVIIGERYEIPMSNDDVYVLMFIFLIIYVIIIDFLLITMYYSC